MNQLTRCNGCGATVTERMKNGAPFYLSVDRNGQATRPHVCGATAATAASAASPAARTATATAAKPNVTGAPSVTDADADDLTTGRGEIPGLSDVWDELQRIDAEEARQARLVEPAHNPIARRYSAEAQADRVSGAYVPEVDAAMRVEAHSWRTIERFLARVDRTGEPGAIGLFGEPGTGKTTLGAQIAAVRRSPLFIFEMASVGTSDECFATIKGITIDDNGARQVIAEPSMLVRGIETPGATVLINDAANMQHRTSQNGLTELLDPSTRASYVPALGRTVRVAERVVIVVTWNPADVSVSASDMSAQIIDRLNVRFEMPPLDDGALSEVIAARSGCNKPTADRLASVAAWMRADDDPIPVSTRELITAAEQVIDGATIGEALRDTVFGMLDVRDRERAYQIISRHIPEDDPDPSRWDVPRDGTRIGLSVVTFGNSEAQ